MADTSEERPIKPWPSEADRAATAAAASAHLPHPGAFKVTHFSEADIEALRAAFRKRFNEDVPRTETMMCVASVGYRMALRDLLGWRENDWPEGFDRRTAEILTRRYAEQS